MPRDIQFERPPAGFAVKAMQPGENGLIEVRGFHTSDEGFDFTHRLEVCDDLIAGLPEISPSQVDHLLAVIQRNGQTTAHVNELTFTSKVHVKRGCKAGEPMMTNDIADITEMNVGVEIPSDCGVIFLFSWRWRKGLFFDLQPLGPKPTPRTYNLDAMFAACYCALMFPEMFSLSEDEWKALLAAGWFPFVGLRTRTRSEMLLYCREGWDLARLHDRIVDECKELVPQFAESCETSPLFRTHAESIKVAARHFTTGDPLSAAHLLYPRIEGVLRTYHLDRGETPTRKTERFFATALQGGAIGRHQYCLLLLDRFHSYLREVIFARFDPANPAGVSRHTIGHGVVDPSQCDEKSVALAFLALHHLYYSLGSLQRKP